VDANPDMVEYARAQAAADQLDVTWMVADLRQFQLEAPVDMAICMFDRIENLLADDDIAQHLRMVEANLVPGGLYLIECTHPRDSYVQDYGHFHYTGSQDGVMAELRWAINNPSYDVVTGVAQVEVELRIVDQGQERVVRDLIQKRAFSAQELRLLTELSGAFQVVDWFGDFRLDQPLDNSSASRRMIAIVQKVGSLEESRERPTCYLSPKLGGRLNAEGGRGVFCREPVQAGERLSVWGGEVVGPEGLEGVDPDLKHLGVQIEEDLYLAPSREGPEDWFNHSCDPNAGLDGQVVLVALRDIAPGSRWLNPGDDWRKPELWRRYAGRFSPYVQRRIEGEEELGAGSRE